MILYVFLLRSENGNSKILIYANLYNLHLDPLFNFIPYSSILNLILVLWKSDLETGHFTF